jgi:hypothetical protein
MSATNGRKTQSSHGNARSKFISSSFRSTKQKTIYELRDVGLLGGIIGGRLYEAQQNGGVLHLGDLDCTDDGGEQTLRRSVPSFSKLEEIIETMTIDVKNLSWNWDSRKDRLTLCQWSNRGVQYLSVTATDLTKVLFLGLIVLVFSHACRSTPP